VSGKNRSPEAVRKPVHEPPGWSYILAARRASKPRLEHLRAPDAAGPPLERHQALALGAALAFEADV
jgi:hypothetical protein